MQQMQRLKGGHGPASTTQVTHAYTLYLSPSRLLSLCVSLSFSHAHTHTHTRTHTHTHTHTHRHTNTHTHTRKHTHAHMHTHTHARMHAHVHRKTQRTLTPCVDKTTFCIGTHNLSKIAFPCRKKFD